MEKRIISILLLGLLCTVSCDNNSSNPTSDNNTPEAKDLASLYFHTAPSTKHLYKTIRDYTNGDIYLSYEKRQYTFTDSLLTFDSIEFTEEGCFLIFDDDFDEISGSVYGDYHFDLEVGELFECKNKWDKTEYHKILSTTENAMVNGTYYENCLIYEYHSVCDDINETYSRITVFAPNVGIIKWDTTWSSVQHGSDYGYTERGIMTSSVPYKNYIEELVEEKGEPDSIYIRTNIPEVNVQTCDYYYFDYGQRYEIVKFDNSNCLSRVYYLD